MKKHIALVIPYILIAGLTYGYAYKDAMQQTKLDWPSLPVRSIDGQLGAIYPAIFWPLYWPAHLGRLLFEDKKQATDKHETK